MMLQRLGFTVVTASEAIEVFKANPAVVCAIVDMIMPTMDGEQCFHELRKIDPRIKVILCSGYSPHEISVRFAKHSVAGFLQKPYTLKEMTSVSKEVVDPSL